MLAHTSATAAWAPPDDYLTGRGAARKSLFAYLVQSAMKLRAGMWLSAMLCITGPCTKGVCCALHGHPHCQTGVATLRKLFVHICLPEAAGDRLADVNLRWRPGSPYIANRQTSHDLPGRGTP